MKNITKTILIVAGLAALLNSCENKPKEQVTLKSKLEAPYQVNLLGKNTQGKWTLYDSTGQYAIPINGNLIDITPDNLCVEETDETWRRTGIGYTNTILNPTQRHKHMAVLRADTLYPIEKDSIYFASDGLGYSNGRSGARWE